MLKPNSYIYLLQFLSSGKPFYFIVFIYIYFYWYFSRIDILTLLLRIFLRGLYTTLSALVINSSVWYFNLAVNFFTQDCRTLDWNLLFSNSKINNNPRIGNTTSWNCLIVKCPYYFVTFWRLIIFRYCLYTI